MFEFNRQLISYINNARTEPKNTAKSIYNKFKDDFHGTELHAFGKIIDTFQGIEALQNLDEYLNNQMPVHALIHSKSLDKAAQLIAQQKGLSGNTQNQKPRVVYEKIQQFAKTDGKIGELISLSAITPNQIASYFMIDDGLATKKRRRMLLDSVYKYIGVGHAAHSQYQTITVIILAQFLQQKDTYFLENERFAEKQKRMSQSQRSFRGSNINQQGRQSEFY